MKELQKRTDSLNKKFEKTLPGPIGKWDARTYLIDLMEEVGELSNAILVKDGNKSSKRKKSEIDNSLADIQFALFMLANRYEIDLENEYEKVLDELEERLERGEFA